MKPHAPATERNRGPILEALVRHVPRPARLLEIGSGTGQHAVYFGEHLPDVQWQPTDRSENLPGIRAWISEAALTNVLEPIELDVERFPSVPGFNVIFSANTMHIMSWAQVRQMIAGAGHTLSNGGMLIVYGPFARGGTIRAASNRDFDASLRAQAPHMGLRDFDDVDGLASAAGFYLVAAESMPANNELLVWRRE